MRRVVLAALLILFGAGALRCAGFDAAAASNRIGLELFRRVPAGSRFGNRALSPCSIGEALALAYAGSGGTTRDELAAALHFPAEAAAARDGFAALRSALAANGAGDALALRSANGLFVRAGLPLRPAFADEARDGYAAAFRALDFAGDTENARAAVNAWVEERTGGKIADLVPEGGVSERTRLVLVNALYFRARWATRFSEAETRDLPFHAAGRAAVPVPTMRIEAEFGYRHEDGFTEVALPYEGGAIECLLLLPDARDGLPALLARLAPEALSRPAGPAQSVALSLPKFHLDPATLRLGPGLRELGVRSAFGDGADFSRITAEPLFLSEAYHQAFVVLNESGTEAAAGTGIVLNSFAVRVDPPKPVEVRVDHPFLFVIRHRATGACLFLGAVVDPR